MVSQYDHTLSSLGLTPGICCDKPTKNPQKTGAPRVHTMDNTSLNVPDETPMSFMVNNTGHPQFYGMKDQQIQDGNSGVGEYFPVQQGTYLVSQRAPDGTLMTMGSLPTTQGGKGDMVPPGQAGKNGERKAWKSMKLDDNPSFKDLKAS